LSSVLPCLYDLQTWWIGFSRPPHGPVTYGKSTFFGHREQTTQARPGN